MKALLHRRAVADGHWLPSDRGGRARPFVQAWASAEHGLPFLAREIVRKRAVADLLKTMGLEVVGSSPTEFRSFVGAQIEGYRELTTKAKILSARGFTAAPDCAGEYVERPEDIRPTGKREHRRSASPGR